MKESNEAIFENAIDFLEKSLDEFRESPKYSVLHFAIAVEILLKARLAIEHWSLVVQKNANKADYLKGDFQSVNLTEVVKRLRGIVGENITKAEFESFKRLASHRNKVIHFYHGEFTDAGKNDDLEKIIKEQCECWFHLKSIFTKRWCSHFEAHLERFESLDQKMRRHWQYLSTVFDRVKPELERHKQKGKSIGICSFCSYKAVPYELESPKLSNSNCLVCNWRNNILELKCECSQTVKFQNDGFSTCYSCGKKYEPEDVYSLIDNCGHDTSDSENNITPANCGCCDGYHTVAVFHEGYICTSCLEFFKRLDQCQYCGEFCSGDIEGSSWTGCAVCDGSRGFD